MQAYDAPIEASCAQLSNDVRVGGCGETFSRAARGVERAAKRGCAIGCAGVQVEQHEQQQQHPHRQRSCAVLQLAYRYRRVRYAFAKLRVRQIPLIMEFGETPY